MSIAVSTDFVTGLCNHFNRVRVLLRPASHKEKRCFRVILFKRSKNVGNIGGIPRAVECDGDFALRRFHRINWQQPAAEAIRHRLEKENRRQRQNQKHRRPNPSSADFALIFFHFITHKKHLCNEICI